MAPGRGARVRCIGDREGVLGAARVSGQTDGPYFEMPLGDLVGLTQYGVHLERLPPGSRSSHRIGTRARTSSSTFCRGSWC